MLEDKDIDKLKKEQRNDFVKDMIINNEKESFYKVKKIINDNIEYWEDGRGNRWSLNNVNKLNSHIVSEDDANFYSKVLTNCYNCIDCFFSENLKSCKDCHKSQYLIECISCTNCNNLSHKTKLDNFDGLTNEFKSEERIKADTYKLSLKILKIVKIMKGE